jgi:hypothetical protein
VLHDRDLVCKRERLGLIVRDEHRRHAELTLQPLEERPGLQAKSRVEVGQRFVEEEQLGSARDRTGQRDPLLLATGELGRTALHESLQRQPVTDLRRGLQPLVLRHLLDPQRVGDVVCHRHVREQRVVLEHHRHVSITGRHVGHVPAAELDPAGGRGLEAGDRTKQSRLAASGRAKQGEELPVGDLQVEIIHGAHAAAEVLHQPVQRDASHQRLIPPWKRKPYRRLTNRYISTTGMANSSENVESRPRSACPPSV